ncbi:MAG: hypothetical protein ACI4JM_06870 [Oscillospiraceae bacterium]
MNSNIKIPFRAPLNLQDSENQTYGCRANNPNICANCHLDGVCAFVTDDSICRRPSKAWKKQYEKLKNEEIK